MLLLVHGRYSTSQKNWSKICSEVFKEQQSRRSEKLIMKVRSRTWWHIIKCSYVQKSVTPLSNSWNEPEEKFFQWLNAKAILHSGLLSLCSILRVHVFYSMYLETEKLWFTLFPAAEDCLVITLLVFKYSYWDFLGQRGCKEVQGKRTATPWILITVGLCGAAVNTFHKTRLWKSGRSTVIGQI